MLVYCASFDLADMVAGVIQISSNELLGHTLFELQQMSEVHILVPGNHQSKS
eukprot:m.132983 g.132983  ORF g.132983 m.132983 type:complete len:52 (-) comp17517_c0_seq1:10-165(-)